MWPFPKRKPKPDPLPMPRWVMLGAIGFVLVIAGLNSRTPAPDQKSPLAEHVGNIASSLPKVENYTTLLPDTNTAAGVTSRVIKSGAKAPFICGQQIDLAIQAIAGTTPAGGEMPLRVSMGDKSTPPFITNFLQTNPGAGAVQQFDFTEKQSLASLIPGVVLNAMVDSLNITVEKTTPDMTAAFTEGQMSIGLFDQAVGTGQGALCGDKVSFRVTLWDASGKQIYTNDSEESAAFSLAIGDNKIMVGLEQSLIGMSPGGKRTVVLPPAWQIAPVLASSDIPAPLKKASKQLMIAEITRID